MPIVGTGIDVAEIPRLRAALDEPQTGSRFKGRVFTPGEQAYCEGRGAGRYESYAARFAAKEATMKALGTGYSHEVWWRDIEVVRRGGPPRLSLSGGAGSDFFHFNSRLGSDTITDFSSAADTLRFSQAGIRIGDGDTAVDGFALRNGRGGFSAATEVVVFTPDVAGLTARRLLQSVQRAAA